MHILFENITGIALLSWLLVFVGMILFNEISRRYMWVAVATLVILPIILSFVVWPNSAGGSNVDNWFQHAKMLSTISSAWLFLGMRYNKYLSTAKWYKIAPMFILSLNILEAVVRELQIATLSSPAALGGIRYIGGPWNYIDAAAGFISFITLCGWFGIYVSKDKHKTMVWPDMMWFWIIAYDIWNWIYNYNCLSDRSFYTLPVLLAATFCAHYTRKGAWLQHRSHTLAMNNIIMFTWPALFVTSGISVQSTMNTNAMWVLSIIALAANVAVLVYQIKTMVKLKRNPLTDEIYTETKEYKELLAEEAAFIEAANQ